MWNSPVVTSLAIIRKGSIHESAFQDSGIDDDVPPRPVSLMHPKGAGNLLETLRLAEKPFAISCALLIAALASARGVATKWAYSVKVSRIAARSSILARRLFILASAICCFALFRIFTFS